jgi:hypothetical protein
VPVNRLIHEKSPYLLQHAHNPVDWYAWGKEAFAAARERDLPIFLSIGYSTCHWCHVMERESFENEAVAKVLNENFIPVKVDREERPDLDRVYMLFVQSSTGSGGWPMSVWLTPDGRPFFGGTYFPPESAFGRPGFGDLLEHLARAWREERERIEHNSTLAVEQLRSISGLEQAAGRAGQEALDGTYQEFRRSFDARRGGFGFAPKFPRPSVLNFLVRYADFAHQEDARAMALMTLDAMARGGMHDHLGGGFHRYSVDERWFVPHFEKMLYDQAQLAVSYLEAFQLTRQPRFAEVARGIFEYVLRDLTHPEGGFYSAEDADSAADPGKPQEKSEGAFYLWTHAELVNILGREDAEIFARRFGVAENGNVDRDPHGEFRGKNILYQARDPQPGEEERLARSAAKLLAIRCRRPRPHLDDKVLAGWNGLMISAFAKGAQILQEPRYAQAARAAQRFLWSRLWRASEETLLRRFRDGEAAIEGFLDDYAYLINGLIDLYETQFNAADLVWAEKLAGHAIERFEDQQTGGFFSTQAGQDDLVLRLKDDYDGAEPSGNSMLAIALLRLARMRSRGDFRRSAERTLEAFAGRMASAGPGVPQMLVALMMATGKPAEIVLAGPREGLDEMVRVVRSRFLPNAVVMLTSDAPTFLPGINDGPTAYVCEDFACQLPVTTAAALEKLLQ